MDAWEKEGLRFARGQSAFVHRWMMLVELRVLHRLAEGPLPLAALAGPAGVPVERMFLLTPKVGGEAPKGAPAGGRVEFSLQ